MSPSHYVALYDLSLGLSRQFAVRAALTAVTLLSVHIFRFSVSSNRCVVRNRSVFMLATTFVAFVLCASPGVLAGPPPVCVLRAFVLTSSSFQFGLGVCPFCHNNAASCTWDSDGKCPTKDIMGTNQDFLAGRTTSGLSLQHVDPEYAGIFRTDNLHSILELVNRAAPGTAFRLGADTALSKVLTAIRTGMTTPSLIMEQWAHLVESQADDDPGKAAKAAIMERMKMLASMKDIVNAVPGRIISSVQDTGVYRWMHAKFSVFVPARGLESKAVLQIAGSDGASGAGTSSQGTHLTTTFIRAKSWHDFMESLNLMHIFVTALGLATATVFGLFLQDFVYGPMRLRDRSWQFAQELYWATLKIIEDSAGVITFANARMKCNINHLYEMAERAVCHHYGAAISCFRTHPWKGGNVDDKPVKAGQPDVEWNGRFTASSTRFCPVFNRAGNPPHGADLLDAEGTCKCNHACFHWVDNKGTKGRCGSKSHGAAKCDNPNQCKDPVK